MQGFNQRQDPEKRNAARFYTNSQGVTGDGVRPSSSRALVPAAPQQANLPATQGGLPAVQGPATQPQPAQAGSGFQPSAAREPDYKARAQVKTNAARDTAAYEAHRAAQDERFREAGNKPTQSPKKGGFRSRLTKGGGGGGAAAAAIYPLVTEASDVARVAQDDNSTKLDVANQVAEGTGRTAATIAGGALGAKAGAGIGAFGGPFAPLTVPAGSLVGGLVGGGLGWWGADKAIRSGREMVGAEVASPVDQIQQPEAQQPEILTDQVDPSVQPAQPLQQPAIDPTVPEVQSSATQQQPTANNVIQDGNSFSASGPIRQGFTVNGQPSAGINIGNPQSEQNRQAVANLMARTPELGAGAVAGFQPQQQGRDGRNFTVVKDDRIQERAEREALNAARMPHRGAQYGQLTANQLNNLRGLAGDIRSDNTSRDNTAANNDANLQAAQMREQGQDRRTGASLSIDQQRLQGEQTERGFRVRQAEQAENLREKYMAAETPEQRSAIAEQLQFLNSQGNNQQGGKFSAQKVQVPIDPADPLKGTREVLYSYDERTGQWGPGPQETGPTGPAPLPNHIEALRKNPSLAAQFEAQYPGFSAQQYLGAN